MVRWNSSITRNGARPTIGPRDAGRLMSLEQFERCRETPGFIYELIDGVMNVSPNPVPLHEYWVSCLARQLNDFSNRNPKQVNFVATGSETIIPFRPGPTRPQPDVAAYRDFPYPPPARWDFVCPLIVAEVISPRREAKDATRNAQLYWLAESIAEYWIIDPQADWMRPTLIALSRRPRARFWREQRLPFGRSYRSPTLPGFTLNLEDAGPVRPARRKRG